MTLLIDRRRLARFFRDAEPAVSSLCLLGLTVFVLHFLPLEILSTEAPTGGDTGSHYYPLYTLVKYALPEYTLRVWSPGNLGGEPQHLHYFPLPFLIMAILAAVVPLSVAFKIGSVIPLFLMPWGAYAAAKGLGKRFPTPTICAATSLCVLFNESYSAWGGNVTSMLAGQFAHLYALALLGFTIGQLGHELRFRKPPFGSAILFSLICLSHAYVYIGIPVVLLSFVLFFPTDSLLARCRHCALAGGGSLLLSTWYVVPMLHNQRWTTSFAITWGGANILQEATPTMLWPCFVLAGVGFCWSFVRAIRLRSKASRCLLGFWALPILFYVGSYFLFPHIGLVDVRAVPQILYFTCLIAGLSLGGTLQFSGRLPAWLLTPITCIAVVLWVDHNVEKIHTWLPWNYSGWRTKPLYQPLEELNEELRGSFSDPRVIYENSDLSHATGTLRVFEMLPYFANRATLESTYLQASILAPYAFDLQARISKTPSCPFRQFPCEPRQISGLLPKLRLMGVGDLILVSEESLEEARSIPFLRERGSYPPWHHFELGGSGLYVQVPSDPVVSIYTKDWKEVFYSWYESYEESKPFLVAESVTPLSPMLKTKASYLSEKEKCSPSVKVDFNEIRLSTDCPGKLHVLAFAYHPTWRADSGEKLYLMSPGFIGIVPQSAQVVLRFGQTWIWPISSLCSVLALIALLFLQTKGINRPSLR